MPHGGKRRILIVMGEVWDFWALLRALEMPFESRYISFYTPRLQGDIDPTRIHSLGERRTNWLLHPLLLPFRIVSRTHSLRAAIQEQRPAYVITHHDDASLSILAARLFEGGKRRERVTTRFVAWLHANPRETFQSAWYRGIVAFLGRRGYRRFDMIVTPSEGNREALIAHYRLAPQKVKAIPNPIDLKRVARLARTSPKEEHRKIFAGEGPIIVTVGRLTRAKGQWHLIRALREIKRGMPDAKLVLIGEGELRERLGALVEELGLKESVFILGFQENPFALIARADLFVLTSQWETFGQALVEAMACGTPVISTDCASGPREIIDPTSDVPAGGAVQGRTLARYGILIPPLSVEEIFDGRPTTKDERTLAEAILLLFDGKRGDALRRRYAKAGKERAKAYDIGTVAKKIGEVFV